MRVAPTADVAVCVWAGAAASASAPLTAAPPSPEAFAPPPSPPLKAGGPTPALRIASARPAAFGTKRSSLIASSTRSRVSGVVRRVWLMTCETVAVETPASTATSLKVGTIALPFPARLFRPRGRTDGSKNTSPRRPSLLKFNSGRPDKHFLSAHKLN